MTSVVLTNIGELTTNTGPVVTDATLVVEEGSVTYAGPKVDTSAMTTEVVDVRGSAVMPGFVDAHTHLVFAGDRSDEFRRRLEGESYSSISAAGGGILSTVRASRAADEGELFALASERVWRMIRGGTTSVEVKSGYGLDLETELRLLRVANRIGDELPVTVKTTFLGAHSVAPEYKGDPDGYVTEVLSMLPEVAPLADYCDVFVEDGVFDVDQARTIFEAAASHGLKARVHAEQLTHFGGARLAAEVGAVSADHLDHVSPEDAFALAEAGVTAVLVPGASYSLGSPQAPGPMLAGSDCVIALATDCNPGTSYFETMSLVVALGVTQMGLTVDQAVRAATAGGARSLEMTDRGIIAPGARADIVVLDAPSTTHIPYRPATNLVAQVFKEGQRVA